VARVRKRKQAKTARPRITRVEAIGELRAEPDWDRYAWATLQYVKLLREKREKPHQSKPEQSA
jgi:hypothetical protein